MKLQVHFFESRFHCKISNLIVDTRKKNLFPISGSEGTIMPEKGAAAFWYDLNSQNHREITTQHGGCPVLKGSKWILNKWMYSFENFAKFPCNVIKGLPFAQPAISHYF